MSTHLKWLGWETAENIVARLPPKKPLDKRFPRKYAQHLVLALFTDGSLRIVFSSYPLNIIDSIVHLSRNIDRPDLASILVSDSHDFNSARMRYLWVDRVIKRHFRLERMVFRDLCPQAAIALFPEGFTCDPLPPPPDISGIAVKPRFTQFTREGIIMQQKENDLTHAQPGNYPAHKTEGDHPQETLVIAGTIIHQDESGRYCLNELHKAAGADERLKPSNWLRTDQTQALIGAIEKSDAQKRASEQNQPVSVVKGGNLPQGTYVCKELVYAYAMWISPEFNLAVIRAFDDLVTGRIQAAEAQRVLQSSGRFPDVVEQAIEARAWRIAEEHRQHTQAIMGTAATGTEDFCWNMAFHVKHSVILRLKNQAENWLLKYKPVPVAEMVMEWNPRNNRF